jgi:hypothetical protein
MAELLPHQTLDLGLFTHLSSDGKVAAISQPEEPGTTAWLPNLPVVPQMPFPAAAVAPGQPDVHVVPVFQPANIANMADQPPPYDVAGAPSGV